MIVVVWVFGRILVDEVNNAYFNMIDNFHFRLLHHKSDR